MSTEVGVFGSRLSRIPIPTDVVSRVRFWLNADRLGPDIALTHWQLHFKSTMRKLCKRRFKRFGDGAEFRPGAYAEACSKISIGDRVVVIAGERNSNQQITTMGFDYDGGWAEYVVTKAELVAKIPDSLAFEQAAIIPDAVSTPWAAITPTGKVVAGEKVAVFGVGGLGIHAVQLLKIIGAFVIAIDPREDARTNALARGADFAYAPDDAELKKHRGLNAVFDFAGVSSVRKQALSMLGEQGRLVIVGIANEPIVIPNDMALTYMRTQIMGHYGSEAHHVTELIELAASGRLDLSHSVSEVMPLESAAQALDKLANKVGNPIRIVLKP